jgi:hypothetical protein
MPRRQVSDEELPALPTVHTRTFYIHERGHVFRRGSRHECAHGHRRAHVRSMGIFPGVRMFIGGVRTLIGVGMFIV